MHNFYAKNCTYTISKFNKDLPLAKTIQKANDDSRVFRFTISTDGIDREGDVIIQHGIDYTQFEKNNVILFGHDYSGLVHGRTIAYESREDSTVMDIELPAKGTGEIVDQVSSLGEQGFIKAVSVGFVPTDTIDKARSPKDELFKQYPNANRIFKSSALLEVSLVTVPANPDAIALRMAKNYACKATEKDLSPLDNSSKPSSDDLKKLEQLQKLLTKAKGVLSHE